MVKDTGGSGVASKKHAARDPRPVAIFLSEP